MVRVAACDALAFWSQSWRFWTATLIAILPLLWMLSVFDKAILRSIQQPEDHPIHALARFISEWGDFYHLSPILLVIGLAWAAVVKNKPIKQASIAIFVAALAAGVLVQVPRSLTGRPRPSAGLPDGIYGPSLEHDYHGFPSGHSCSAFATAAVLTTIAPPLGTVAIPAAASVAWSRLQLNRHHLSDVIGGAALGCTIGTCFGMGFRKRRKEQQTLRNITKVF